MPAQLLAESRLVPGGKQIQVQQLGLPVDGQELAGQEGTAGGGIQLPHVSPCRGVRQAQVLGNHALIGLDTQRDIAVVAMHCSRSCIPVGIHPGAAPKIGAVGIQGVAYLAFQLLPPVGQAIIFRNHGHPVDGQVGEGTPAALFFPVEEAAGLDAQVGIASGLPQPVAGQKMAAVERVALRAEVRAAQLHQADKSRLGLVAAQVGNVLYLVADVDARVVVLIHHHGLEMLVELHPHQTVVVRHTFAPPCHTRAQVGQSRPHRTGIFLQDYVERRLLAEADPAQGLHLLMMLQHLHILHFVRRDVVAGHGILPAHQVEPLDVESVDGFALILNAAVRLHLQSRHLGNDVGNGAVLGLLEVGYGISQRISPLGNAFGLCHHFPKLEGRFRQYDVLPVPESGHRQGDGLVAHEADGQVVGSRQAFQGEMPVPPHDCKGQEFTSVSIEHDIGPIKRLAGRIVHSSLERRGGLSHPPRHPPNAY